MLVEQAAGDDPMAQVEFVQSLTVPRPGRESPFAFLWIASRELVIDPDSSVRLATTPGTTSEVYRGLTLKIFPDSQVLVSGSIPGADLELRGRLSDSLLTINRIVHQTRALSINREDVKAVMVRLH